MATPASAPQKRLRKPPQLAKLNHSPNLGRSALFNQYRRTVDALTPTHGFPRLSAFLPQHLWKWISAYLKYALTRRYPFPAYPGSGDNGVYPLAPEPGTNQIVIAIAGDWGTGTQEAETIAGLMCHRTPGSEKPDLTIHLGDVYYVGDEPEIDENCFGKETQGYQGVTWPHGRRGSFALNGNHEMYANGTPYFTKFLPTLGLPDGAGQLASFFCLETEFWRILAIDTGYNSVGIPVLSQIPLINSIPFIGGDCHLEKKLLQWLRDVVKPQGNRKATLLLSHHQYFTAFPDHAYAKPAKQLMEFFAGQEVVWLWGHEHRMGIYGKFNLSGGITAYGRCVGHGGMPVDLGTPDPGKAPLQYYDPRRHALDDGTMAGTNGYVVASIQRETLTLEYRDIDDTQLLVETFTADAAGSFRYGVQDPAGILMKV